MRSRIPLYALLLMLALPLVFSGGVFADEDGKDPNPKGKSDDGKGDKDKKDAEKPAPAPPAKYGLAKLQQELDGLRDRLIYLSEQANKDPKEREIEEYAGYSVEQFANQKKRVRAKKLVEYVFDSELNFEVVRKKAMEALVAVNKRWRDPDLSTERRSSSSPSPRSVFCTRNVVKKLADKDAKSRWLAHQLLIGLWNGTPATLLGPQNYKPAKKHKKTWDDAIGDWKKYLKRR